LSSVNFILRLSFITLLLLSLCLYFFFFFFMLRRPPRSTLFPTRRSSDLSASSGSGRASARPCRAGPGSRRAARSTRSRITARPRSEEHTSELQSLRHLVCRLLLEKKKKTRWKDRREQMNRAHNERTLQTV